MKKIEKTKKLFLTDKANFKEIREQGGVYVDKTKQIYDCIGKSTYFFLSRPRRFGKSTLCRTLEQLFLGNRSLFKGLWIDKSDWEWKKHPVIYLDMSEISHKETTPEILKKSLSKKLKNIAAEYDVTFDITDAPTEQFSDLIELVSKKFKMGAVVIIDEYDKPILDCITTDEPYKKMHNLISSLYGQLKPKEKYLRFAFMTGVFKFTKTSIFSNLNNLNDLTFAPQAGNLVGYTQEELESNFSEEIDLLARTIGESKSLTLERLRSEYDGYRFGVALGTGQLSMPVYNPFAINHTFAANDLVERWFASGSPSFLIQKVQEGRFEAIKPEGLFIDYSTLAESCSPDGITALPLDLF